MLAVTRGTGADNIEGGDRQSGHLTFITEPHILQPANSNMVAGINPPDGAEPLPLDFDLSAGVNITGKIVDPDGTPVTGAVYCGDIHYFDVWRLTKEDTFEVNVYEPNQPRRLLFYESKRNLAAYRLLTGDLPTQLVIRMEPAGTIRGRLVDERGLPVAAAIRRERTRSLLSAISRTCAR